MPMISIRNAQRPPLSLQDELVALATMNLPALRERYLSIFKERTSSHNTAYLRKRIAFRLQELAEGGISERAKRRARELAADAPIRRRGLNAALAALSAAHQAAVEANGRPPSKPKPTRDPRLPPPGTKLRKSFDGREHVVAVTEDGFLYGRERFGSLSKVAHTIAGTNWNGFAFFALTKPWGGSK